MLYHAFEVVTARSRHVRLDPNQSDFERLVQRLLDFLANEVETWAYGTVEAHDIDEAIDKIRRGK